MAADDPQMEKRLDGFMITDDAYMDDEPDEHTEDEEEDSHHMELQTLPHDDTSNQSRQSKEHDRTPQEILYDNLTDITIDEADDDHLDRDYLFQLFTENHIDSAITNLILNTQDFMSILDFLSWQDELTVKGVSQLMKNSKDQSPPDFVAPTSLEMETIEANTLMGGTDAVATSSTALASSGPSTGNPDDEKYPFTRDTLPDVDLGFTTNEYACKRCARPVSNNVFMEKTVEECTSKEIKVEVDRLICCLHFLATEFDIFNSLKGYLKAIESVSKENDVSSPFAISRKSSDSSSAFSMDKDSKHKPTITEKEEIAFMIKRSDTSHHIQWLHMAYVKEKTMRFHGKDLASDGEPPDWESTIKKKKLTIMYEHLKNVFNETVSDLSEPYLKANAEKYGLTESDAAYATEKRLVEDLKRRLKQRETMNDALSVESDDMIINKLSTYAFDEEMNKYEGNEAKYDPLYTCTPSEDEMICYESVCRVVFDDNVSSNNLDNVSLVQKIKKAFNLLRACDSAVALSTNGWVTTIDNILCVLLYRDISWHRSNFIGELKISLVVQGAAGTDVSHYESAAVLRAIKQGIRSCYIGIPKLNEAVDNAFDVQNVLLREKETEQAHICACCPCGACETNHLVRLTFGIQCDDSRCDTSNVQDIYKFNKQFPYKFLYQAKRIFEQIYRRKFGRLFDTSARKLGAQLKLYEIHSYDLTVSEYPKTEIDTLLTQQYALPSSSVNPLDSHEIMNLQTVDSMRYGMTPMTPATPMTGDIAAMYGHTGGNMRTQRANTVDTFFANAFNTSNMQQFGDTIIEDDYGVPCETRIVNALNMVLNWVNPTVVYKKIRVAIQQPKQQERVPDLVAIPADPGPPSEMKSEESLEQKEVIKEETGHRICCGHCYVTVGMICFAILMAVIVGAGGYNIWKIGEAPMEPTLVNILSFTEQMIATEAEYVAERALFSTQQFIDFTKVLPGVTHSKSNEQIFKTFLNDELIAAPRFDGVFQISYSPNTNKTMANFIFKDDSNTARIYDCDLEDTTGANCDDDLFYIADKLWGQQAIATQHEVTGTYFVANSVINPSLDGGCIWFVTWRYIEPKKLILGGLFFGSRINDEYAKLTLAKKGVVYWMSDDDHKDVFVTSIPSTEDDTSLLHISEHLANNSSIHLDSNFGYSKNTEYKDNMNQVDSRILDTIDKVILGQNITQISPSNATTDYYIYSRLQTAIFGSFHVVIVFPVETVQEQILNSQYVVFGCTVLAMLCAVLNACMASAVPLIPADDSWLSIPLFTEQDKKELQDNTEQMANLTSPERRAVQADNIDDIPSVALSPTNHTTHLTTTATDEAIMNSIALGPRSAPADAFVDETNEVGADSEAPSGTRRMRSHSDETMRKAQKHKKGVSLADAKQRLKALANEDLHSTVALKKGSTMLPHANTLVDGASDKDSDDDDDDEDNAPPPFLKAVSVATGSKPENIARSEKNLRRKDKKEIKKKLALWKKKKQSDQLKKNIDNAHMRSIFNRGESKYKTKYAQTINNCITFCCFLIAVLICLAYLGLRRISENDIEELMESHLNISNRIVEAHAEFKVYQHGLALQQGQLLIMEYELEPYNQSHNERLLSSFYGIFDELSGMFTFVGAAQDHPQISNLSLYGSIDEECVQLSDIRESYLATCISWTGCGGSTTTYEDITDCVLYRAIQETYDSFANNVSFGAAEINYIAWSVPFACFGARQICYVGLTRANGMYIGALLSMHGLADTAQEVVWASSGMKAVVKRREGETETAYDGDEVHFSFYLYTQIRETDQLAAAQYDINADYLLAATDNEVIKTSQTAYGVRLADVLFANESTNDQVLRTYVYLTNTNQMNRRDIRMEPVIAENSWSYPKIVYFWFENDDGLNWISVLTVSAEIFVGDFSVYFTLGGMSLIGWVIIYLFVHFVLVRRFEENIEYWEHLYMLQIEKDTFPLFLEPTAEEIALLAVEEEEEEELLQQEQEDIGQQQQQQQSIFNMNDEEEQLTLDFISANIRDTVRVSCKQSWIRLQQQEERRENLPTRRRDITDHYHSRALRHIYQAKRGMNIITVVQMEQYGRRNEYKLKLYALQSSRAWRWFLQCIIMIHIFGLVWFRLDLAAGGYTHYTGALIIEWICLFFEFADLLLTYFIQFRWQNTSRNPLMSPNEKKNIFLVRSLVWLAVVVDVLLTVFASPQWSFTRVLPIRPLLLILSNDKLIGACYALVITSLNAADALLLFVMLLGIAAVSGVILFRFDSLMSFYNVYSFQNVIRSVFTTYIFIISGENYGELVYVSFEKNPAYIIYFVILTVLGSWIVVSLVVSRFQTSFKEIYTKERERRIYFKRTGYVAAFSLINLDDDNEVSKAEFESFVRYIQLELREGKNNKKEEIEQLRNLNFDAFDADGDDSIDIREFVIKLEEIYQKPVLIDIMNDDDSLLSWIRLNIVETEAFSQFVLVVILIQFILFTLFGIYPGDSSTQMLDLLLAITVLLNGLDIAVKIISMGWDYYWNSSKCRIINRHKVHRKHKLLLDSAGKRNTLDGLGEIKQLIEEKSLLIDDEEEEEDGEEEVKKQEQEEVEYEVSVYTQDPLHLKEREFAHRFDLVIVSCAILLFVGSRVFVLQQLWFSDETNTLRAVMVIPLLRLLTLIKTTRSAVYIITRVLPRFTSLIAILLMLFYAYGVIGVWLIADSLQRNLLTQPQYSFETFSDALVTLFQLTVGEGWHDVMYAAVYANNSLLSSTWYFLTFVLIITLVFTNLFVGLVISVVDDVETENKFKYGQLKLEYQQQQMDKKMKENQKRKQKKEIENKNQQDKKLNKIDEENGANSSPAEIIENADIIDTFHSDIIDTPTNLPGMHHAPHSARRHRPNLHGTGAGSALSRKFMSQRKLARGRTQQQSQFISHF
eukprot:585111_1